VSGTERRTLALRWGARGAVIVVLVLVASRVGAGAFVDGFARLTPLAVLVALAATALATLAAAWRWTTIARAFGLAIPFRTAVPAYYRSQLLNTVLPGGVTGDVARGLAGAPGERLRGLRAVAWDRGTGQAVQLVLLGAALAATTGREGGAVVTAVCVAGCAGLVLLARSRPRAGDGPIARGLRGLRRDLLVLAARPRTVLPVIGGSAVVCLVHASLLVLAAAVTGVAADPLRLLPLALIVQTALMLPTGFGGLGAREGVAAAAFSAAGLGAAHGVSAGIAAGALGLIAVLPGVVPLLARPLRRRVAPASRLRADRPAVSP
jgi:uncharacterized membrane protein YbhN (UPF0104 family)